MVYPMKGLYQMKRINKMKLVKKIIGGGLAPYNFVYSKKVSNTWIFKRCYEDVEQFVAIYDSFTFSGLRVELYTSVDTFNRKEIDRFYPLWQEKYNKFFWKYSDEASFISALNEFVPIIIDYGLEELNKMSIPTREQLINSTDEMEHDLFVNYDAYAKEFMKKYNLKIDIIKNIVPQVSQIITDNLDKDFDEYKSELIKMAAFYGVCISSQYKGKWHYENAICIIKFKDKGNKMTSYPLTDIIFSWRDNESLYEMFYGMFRYDPDDDDYIE